VSGPGALQTFVADVSDSEQVLGYATRAFELWGKVDGFVNNAGIQTPVRPIVEFHEEDFDRVMAVNIRGVLGMKYVLPRMRDGGSVVNMSSALGVVGGAGIVAYVASKHAIIGMSKTAALEQGTRGIRVNACAPGPIAGRMTFNWLTKCSPGPARRSPRPSRWVATARRRTWPAWLRSCYPTTPAMPQERPTLSMAASQPPSRNPASAGRIAETERLRTVLAVRPVIRPPELVGPA
jgi:NAD(P)-dependent dehydrogenase (short-subunit alcohol dehydrogenase family)